MSFTQRRQKSWIHCTWLCENRENYITYSKEEKSQRLLFKSQTFQERRIFPFSGRKFRLERLGDFIQYFINLLELLISGTSTIFTASSLSIQLAWGAFEKLCIKFNYVLSEKLSTTKWKFQFRERDQRYLRISVYSAFWSILYY